jgi:single-stranded DNA-binding protein
MSGISALVSGVLARDPERRRGARGEFATATIRAGNGDAVQWVSVIAFADQAERLWQLGQGDAISAAGRLELRTWHGNDGTERSGLSLVAGEVAAARPRPRERRASVVERLSPVIQFCCGLLRRQWHAI